MIRFLFLLPILPFAFVFKIYVLDQAGPEVTKARFQNLISLPEVENVLFSLQNQKWQEAWQHFQNAFSVEAYVLAALFLLSLIGLKLFLSHPGRPAPFIDDFANEDLEGEGNHMGNEGLSYADKGQHDKAISYYERALTIAQKTGDRLAEGNTWGNMGNSYHALGNAKKAIGCHKQALAVFKQIGDRRGAASVLANIGRTHCDYGKLDTAINYNLQSLKLFEEIGSPHAVDMRRWLEELKEKLESAGG